jgi:nitrite reductase/ring-hydroxylating ferredoxin subunit
LLPVKIATIDQIKPNKANVVKVDDANKEAIILNVKDRFYAFQSYCMHHAFPLEFSAKAKMLTCPLHGSKFNIETGNSRLDHHHLHSSLRKASLNELSNT